MIVKELDKLSSEDKFVKAGQVAEEQMVYYLRRAFADDKIFMFSITFVSNTNRTQRRSII